MSEFKYTNANSQWLW